VSAERIAQAVNSLKGKVTMIYINHQAPNGFQVDEVVNTGRYAIRMSLVGEKK
jgi:subfamily B ATP-binding cassette protein HlyB/CyaB